jgi:MFS family permease
MIICGLINYITHFIAPSFANINLLGIYCILGCFGPFFIYKIDDEISLKNKNDDYQRTKADWSRITKALLPTFLIAFGAGFTIPFINLFFNIVHGVNSSSFSLMNTIAFGLVVIGGFLNPIIKRKLGYKVAITFFQSLAIFALFVMGASEWFAGSYISTMVAIMMYIIRQPLMNIAAPLTTEVAMKYVGEENRKVVSAITSALWSGSWFLSAMIFSILRELNISYSNIIFTTVIFYILGVISYYKLILNYEREIEPN